VKRSLCCLFLAIASVFMAFGMDTHEAGPAEPMDRALEVQDNPFQAMLAPEFQVPPIVMRMARSAARSYGVKQLPLMAMFEFGVLGVCKNLFDTLLYAYKKVSLVAPECFCGGRAISKKYAEGSLNAPELQDWFKKIVIRDPVNVLLHEIIRRIYHNSHFDVQDTILLYPSFFIQNYGTRRAVIAHELWHIVQFGSGRRPLNIEYCRGDEHEADIQAARSLNCRKCIEEYSITRAPQYLPHSETADEYAFSEEVCAIADEIPDDQLCPYHSRANICYQALHQLQLHPFVSGAVAVKLEDWFDEKASQAPTENVKKICQLLRTATSMPGFLVTWFCSARIQNWLGQDIEDEIACGE